MHFIFMLTRQDQTVANCLDLVEQIKPLGLEHIGFKDVGVDAAVLHQLNQKIQSQGAKSYLEIVDTSPKGSAQAAKLAVELGVDYVLGGIEIEHILPVLQNTNIKYFPYVGTPYGHPTYLKGNAENITRDCQAVLDKGCKGAVLLAYRSTSSRPEDLIQAARTALGPDNKLIVAGSVSNAETVQNLIDLEVNAFTAGTAIIDREFVPNEDSIAAQIQAILKSCEA